VLEPVPDDVVPLPIELEPDGVVPVPGATLPELLVGAVGDVAVSPLVVPGLVDPLERVLPEFIDPVEPVLPELIEPVEPVLPELIEPVEPVLPEFIEPVDPVPVVLLVELADPLLPVPELLMPEPVLPGVAVLPEGDVALDPVVPPAVLPLVCATARPPPIASDTAAARVNNGCLCVLLMMCSCRKLDMTVRSGCPLQRSASSERAP
jgi:hypothetical protein